MADNLVSKFTVNSQGTDIDIKIKDTDARNLIAQEIADRSKLIKTDENNNTVIETSNKLIESSQGREIIVNGIVNETVNNLTLVGKNELKFKSDSLVLDSNEEPIKLGMNVTDDLYYGTLKVREASGNVREIMVKNNGTPNLTPAIKFTNYILVGDSYAGGWTPDGNVTGWPTLLHRLLKGNLYGTITQSGAGLSAKLTGDFNLTTKIDSFANSDEVDSIICCCGRNDIDGDNVIGGINQGIKDFVNACHTKFKNAKVYIGFIGWDLNKTEWTETKSLNLRNAIAVYKNVDADYIYINTDFILRQRSYMASDGKHPNQDGQNALAYGIKCALYGGIPSYTKPFKQHRCKDQYSNNDYLIHETFTGGITFLQFSCPGESAFYKGPTTSIRMNGYELHIIKNIELDYIVPSHYNLTSMQATILIKMSNETYYNMNVPVYFKDNGDGTWDLVMLLVQTSPDGHGWAEGVIEFINLHGSIVVANELT